MQNLCKNPTGILHLSALPDISRCCCYQFVWQIWHQPRDPGEAALGQWCVQLCWISIEGAWNAGEQCPGLHRAKHEGQQSLITTLKHYQHLLEPKTTLSPGINLLNHLIINLSRGKVGQQEPICQQPLGEMHWAIFYWEQREKGLPSFINFKHSIYLCGKQGHNGCK